MFEHERMNPVRNRWNHCEQSIRCRCDGMWWESIILSGRRKCALFWYESFSFASVTDVPKCISKPSIKCVLKREWLLINIYEELFGLEATDEKQQQQQGPSWHTAKLVSSYNCSNWICKFPQNNVCPHFYSSEIVQAYRHLVTVWRVTGLMRPKFFKTSWKLVHLYFGRNQFRVQPISGFRRSCFENVENCKNLATLTWVPIFHGMESSIEMASN